MVEVEVMFMTWTAQTERLLGSLPVQGCKHEPSVFFFSLSMLRAS